MLIENYHKSRNQSFQLNIFWIGFSIYTLTYTIITESRILILISQSLQLASLVLMAFGMINLIEFKFKNNYLKILYSIYCLWLLILVLKGFHLFLKFSLFKSYFLGAPYGGLLYFSPLILLFPKNIIFYKKLFNVIIVLGVFYLVYDILFIKQLLAPPAAIINMPNVYIVELLSVLAFSCGFILLTINYHSKKKRLIAIIVMLVAFLFAMIRARRGVLWMYGSMLFAAYLLFILTTKKKFVAIYVSLFIGLMATIYVSGIFKPNNSKIFGFLLQRADEDTRSGVEQYFYSDMKTIDWIKGRGIDGQYFCPDIEEDQVTNYRGTIETGYLQTILNGGLISLGLFLLIAVPAVIKGLFFSKNILSKAAALWILMSIINLYPATVNSFTLSYLIVWISIGICYSDEIRNIPEKKLKLMFNHKAT